jgi:asparagine synthase (glutamine-hydrolysing)
MDRPKKRYSLPIYSWLRGDLSYLIEEYLSKEAIALSGIFDENFVLKKFSNLSKVNFITRH